MEDRLDSVPTLRTEKGGRVSLFPLLTAAANMPESAGQQMYLGVRRREGLPDLCWTPKCGATVPAESVVPVLQACLTHSEWTELEAARGAALGRLLSRAGLEPPRRHPLAGLCCCSRR